MKDTVIVGHEVVGGMQVKMRANTGLFIAIEGVDGSGKNTQFVRLQKRLHQAGYETAIFTFPQYDQPSSYFVRAYLDGHYGDTNDVGPYTSSLFYALDRYEAAPHIQAALDAGKIVLIDRYVGSNMAHQGTKFNHAEERRGYFIWLDNLEFELLRIPRPDANIVLRVPAETAHDLITRRTDNASARKRDMPEKDLDHLKKTVEVYDDMCQLFPRDFQRVDCTRGGELLDIDTIHEIVWQKIEPFLPTKPKERASEAEAAPQSTISDDASSSKTNSSNLNAQGPFIPDTLAGDIRGLYIDVMTRILAFRSEVAALLVDHTDPARELALGALLPVGASTVAAALDTRGHKLTHIIGQLTKGHIPAHYSDHSAPLRLTQVWPRNELDLVADVVYPGSDLPLDTLQEAAAEWPYELKLKLLEAYLGGRHDTSGHALHKARYTWDVLCDYASLYELRTAMPELGIEHQALTPRYGYTVPKIIEDADLTEQFEACFDLSLQLYSSLQEAGFAREAQYAALLGHKTRATLTHSAVEALELFALGSTLSANTQKIVQRMHEKLGEVHPIIGESAPVIQKVLASA